MRDLDLTSLRLFIAVCESRSITRVAADETIVVSAISKRLTQLEDTVGAKLLVRSKAGVRVTPAGETLLQHAYGLREKLGSIERDMGAHAEVVRGHVRIFAASTAVAEFLPEALAAFLKVKEHEHIQVDLEEHLSHQVVFGVRRGLAPLGICWDIVDCSGLMTREFRRDQLGIVVYRGHPLTKLKRVAFEQTLPYDHIGMQPSTAFQIAQGQSNEKPARAVRYRAVVASFDAAIRLAHAGLGLAIVPNGMVEQFQHADEIAFIPLTDAWARRRFVLCALNFRTLNPAAVMLADFLCDQR